MDAAVRFARRHEGTPAWVQLSSELEPVHLELVEKPIQRRKWYPLELYAHVLELAARRLSPDDPNQFLLDLGRFVMDDGVNSIYKAFFRIASPSFVIRGSALLWRLFFKGNKLKVTRSGKRFLHVSIQNTDTCWHGLCVSIAGGMISGLEHAGAHDVEMTTHRCRSQHNADCVFSFVWR